MPVSPHDNLDGLDDTDTSEDGFDTDTEDLEEGVELMERGAEIAAPSGSAALERGVRIAVPSGSAALERGARIAVPSGSAAPPVPSLSPVQDQEEPPFPYVKCAVICFINLSNSASYLMTYPFVAFMIMHFYPQLSTAEVGFYSGLLEGAFHVGCVPGAIIWSLVADRYGRRPALLWGLFGTVVSCVGFGMSPNFATALLFRFTWGLLNGNVGVAKTVMSELVPDSQMARAFSYIGLNAGAGRMIGPAMGGFLSDPNARFGWQVPLFATFPFFFPCAVAAVMSLMVFLATYFFLEETLSIAEKEEAGGGEGLEGGGGDSLETANLLEEGKGEQGVDTAATLPTPSPLATTPPSPPPPPTPKPPVGRDREGVIQSFTRLSFDPSVGPAVFLYAILGTVGILSQELFPLYAINGSDRGGFSMKSADLGSLNAACGPFLIIFQMFFFERVAKSLGNLGFQRWTLLLYALLLTTTPLLSFAIGLPPLAFNAIVYSHFVCMSFVRVQAFTINFVIVANSALPLDRAKCNGLGQSLVSVGRGLAPPLITPLFAWSVSEWNTSFGFPLNYGLCFYLLGACTMVAWRWACLLPPSLETKRKVGGGETVQALTQLTGRPSTR